MNTKISFFTYNFFNKDVSLPNKENILKLYSSESISRGKRVSIFLFRSWFSFYVMWKKIKYNYLFLT